MIVIQKNIISIIKSYKGIFGLRANLIILSALLLCSGKIYSQDYQIQITKVVDKAGKPPSSTFAFVEDKHGFIWFGTTYGLYRFDGFNYKIFRHVPTNKNSLSNNNIWDMAIDKKGQLWIATEGGGLDVFNPEDESFINYSHTGKSKNEIGGNSVWSVLIDRKENVWIGVSGFGLNHINTSTGKISFFSLYKDGSKLAQDKNVYSLLEDREGNIWAGFTQGGITKINPETKSIKRYYFTPGESENISNNMVYDLYMDIKGQIWAATIGSGVLKYDKETDGFIQANVFSGKNSSISPLCRSIDERVHEEFWVATEQGLGIFNIKTGFSRNLHQNECKSGTLKDNRLRKIFVDSKGIIWIGTESGVEKCIVQSNFKTIDFFSGENQSGSAIINSIAEREEYLWVGFINHGLFKYSFKTGEIKKYKNIYNPKDNVTSNINAVFNDSRNNLWVTDWYSGLAKYNPKEDKFINIANADWPDSKISDNRLKSIIEGRQGNLWIASEGGLIKYNSNTENLIYFRNNPEDINSLSSNSIQAKALTFDKDSNLWVGTWSFGLNKMVFTDNERTSAKITRWLHQPENPNTIPSNNVIALYADNEVLWIGTFGGGLSKFSPETNQFVSYKMEDGLPSNIIFAIYPDDKGNLWLSTDNGISMFNVETKTFTNYTTSDGLQGKHFFWGAGFKNKKGEIFFGGTNGLNYFNPERILNDTTHFAPRIVDIKLFGKSIEHGKYNTKLNEVHFNYNENFVSFEFSGLDYSAPEKSFFKYKLEGFDKEWINNRHSNIASYTNIPPGQYYFKILVTKNNSSSSLSIPLTVIITPPWWQTLWARLLFSVFFIAILFSVYKMRINSLKKQRSLLEEQVQRRTLEVRNKNAELQDKYEEIVSQEDEIRKQANKLHILSEKLKDSNLNLSNKVKERTIELEKALLKAEDAQKLISSFLSNLSHEIRTPLNAIMGFSQLMVISNIDEIKKNRYDSYIEKNVDSLLTQIENIMDVSKLHTDQYELINESFELNNVFLEVYNSKKTSQKITNEDIQLKHIPAGGMRLISDMWAFKSIVENLIDNSIKYTEKGLIEFGYELSSNFSNNVDYIVKKGGKNTLTIFVKDTGIGIPDELQEVVFDAFRKIETKDKLYRGTGIGLALVKNLCNKLNGIIKLESTEGEGTNIYISFPVEMIY